MPLVRLEEVREWDYRVVYEPNGICLGEIMMDESGTFGFWPEKRSGYWTAQVLLEIGAALNTIQRQYEERYGI